MRGAVTAESAQLTDFYVALAQVSFTMLGLWWVVVQVRRDDWLPSHDHRRMAYAISLHFALPGIMSLVSIIDPSTPALWRLAFAAAAGIGAAGLLAAHGSWRRALQHSRLRDLAYWTGLALYLLVALVAAVAEIVKAAGVPPRPLEALLLSLLVFLGFNVAWISFMSRRSV